MNARSVVSTLGMLAAAGVGTLAAQDNGRFTAQTGAEFRTLSFGKGLGTTRLSEFVVPIGFSLPLSQRLTVDAGTYIVSAQREAADTAGNISKTTINGLTDVLVRGAFQLKPDVAVLTVGINLPTGQRSLDGQQLVAASGLGMDLVPFPVTNFGTGFSVTTGLALAAPVGGWALGIAGSYRYTGSYQPLAGDTSTLVPGGEIRVRLGADRIVGQGRISVGVTYSTFSNDEFGGQSRSPGARLIPQLSWSTQLGNSSLALYGWDVYRTIKDTTQATNFINTFAVGAQLSMRSGTRNSLRPQVEFRKGTGLSGGTLVSAALRYYLVASDRLTVIPGARFDTGKLELYAGPSATVTGLSANLTLRATF